MRYIIILIILCTSIVKSEHHQLTSQHHSIIAPQSFLHKSFSYDSYSKQPSFSPAQIASLKRLRQRVITPNEIKAVNKSLNKSVDEMSRDELLKILQLIYFIDHDAAKDLVRHSTDGEVRKRIQMEVQHILAQEEGTLALSHLEGSDSNCEMRSIHGFSAQNRGTTAAVVVLFNSVLKKLFGYDILENAEKEVQRARIRAQEAIRLGVNPKEIHPKLIEEVMKKAEDKDREFLGIPVDPQNPKSLRQALQTSQIYTSQNEREQGSKQIVIFKNKT